MIKIHIEVYSHFFKCFNFDAETRKHITAFTGKQAQLELVPNPDRESRRKYIYELKKIFAGFNKRRTEFRFHRNQLDPFIEYLKIHGYYDRHLDIKHMPLVNGTPVKFELTDKRSPRDYQVPYIDYLASEDRKANEAANKILILQTGKGKLQPLSSKIKVPGGWSTMGEMQPGTIISMPDGTTAPVSNIYPHGVMDVYKVEFEDGRFTYAGAEHLWEVEWSEGIWGVMDTNEVLAHLNRGEDAYVRLIEPCKKDPEVTLSYCPYKAGLMWIVRDSYLDTSAKQRTMLLKGLLQLNEDAVLPEKFTIDSIKENLAKNIVYLVRSLGGIASYDMDRSLCKVTGAFPTEKRRLKLTAITLSHQEETQCIEVDHKDHLYITDDFIVTHNTFVSLQSIFRIGERVLLTLTRETYIHKWKDDVKQAYGLEEDDVYILQGKQSILELSQMAKDGRIDPIKFIICSTRTLSDFIKFYEEAETEQEVIDTYGMLPDQMWETCGIGCRFIDEVHEHFHSVFKLDMYTHVPYAISLTATLLSDSPFVERQMCVAFPNHIRPKPTPFDQYIDVMAYFYALSPGHKNKVRYKQPGRGSYSHVALEKSILKDKGMLTNYMMIIDRIMTEKYFGIREGNQKLIIFASTIKMCNTIVSAFKQRYHGEDIRKYTAEDSYEDLMAAKIIVATPGSAGTAVDIPDLLTAICTVNVRSKVANVQMLGRLRRLEDYPDTTPQFAYMVCDDIRAHLDYHDHKMKLFRDKARQHGEERVSTLL